MLFLAFLYLLLKRNIENYFLVMFRCQGPPSSPGRLYLAVDDVSITSGKCSG
jgi:hypothetical protein